MKVDEKNAPWIPPAYNKKIVAALKALEFGEASPEQQKWALEWIINSACCAYEMSFRPTSDRDTAFAEGRRFVGLQIVKMLKLNLSTIFEPGEQP